MFQVPDANDTKPPLTTEEKCVLNDEFPHRQGINNLI